MFSHGLTLMLKAKEKECSPRRRRGQDGTEYTKKNKTQKTKDRH